MKNLIYEVKPVQNRAIPWGWTNKGNWVVKPRGEIVMPRLVDYFDWNHWEVSQIAELPITPGATGTTAMKSVFTTATRFLGAEEAMIQLYTGKIMAGLYQIAESMLEWNEWLIELSPFPLEIAVQGDEIGSTHGMMISPELYRERLKPIHARFAELYNAHNIPVWYHSDGWIGDVLPDLKEVGFHGIYYESVRNMPELLADNGLGAVEVVR